MNQLDYFVTTTIPYVNGLPHIGHALEFVQADALKRVLSLSGQKVILQTGTDDNALKNVRSAQQAGISPQQFVDHNAEKFQHLCSKLSINYDTFVRTSSQAHKDGVHEFWRRLNPDDFYLKKYSGLYCSGCEDFFKESDLVNGLCPDHKTPPEIIEEENVFFKLSKYQSKLEQLMGKVRIRFT